MTRMQTWVRTLAFSAGGGLAGWLIATFFGIPVFIAVMAAWTAYCGVQIYRANRRMRKAMAELDDIMKRLEEIATATDDPTMIDRCRTCGRLVGIGIPALHLGVCDTCAKHQPYHSVH